MALGALGVVVQTPVMALGKNGDAVDMRSLHRASKPACVKVTAHVRHGRARMEIEMHLTKAKYCFQNASLLIPKVKFPRVTEQATVFRVRETQCFVANWLENRDLPKPRIRRPPREWYDR